jgi:hypothetical protein
VSKPETFEEAVDSILAEMRATMIAKQRDYGPLNISKFGEYGVLVRSNDKLERLINLYNSGNNPANEPLDDSWLDLGNYSLIALMLRRDIWGIPMEDGSP